MAEGIIIRPEWYESFKELTKAEVGELVMAAFDYRIGGRLPEFTDRALRMTFLRWKAELDADQQKYQDIVEKRRQAGKLGGRPKKETEKAKKPNGLQETLIEEREIDKNRLDKNRLEREGTLSTDAPALEDIRFYFTQMGFASDPDAFEAYYSARDWTVNGQKVTEWEKLAKSWELREKKYETKKGGDPGDIGFDW